MDYFPQGWTHIDAYEQKEIQAMHLAIIILNKQATYRITGIFGEGKFWRIG